MIALSRIDGFISICDTKSGKASTFSSSTGEKIRGDFDMEPSEVLYMAWRQTQSPKLNETQLRSLYRKEKP
jgi:hypothetical protein